MKKSKDIVRWGAKEYDLKVRKDLVALTKSVFKILDDYKDENSTYAHNWRDLQQIVRRQQRDHESFRPSGTPRTVSLSEGVQHFCVRVILEGFARLGTHDMCRYDYRLDFILGQAMAKDSALDEYLVKNELTPGMREQIAFGMDYCVLANGGKS